LAKLAVDTVLDVGAHHGESGLSLRRAGFTGELISFEPAPEAFAALEEAAHSDPLWRVVPLALGSEDAERELEVRGSSTLTSFLPKDELGSTFEGWNWQIESTIPVTVKRLDSVLDAYTTKPVFAKIDTQGYDLEVIRGAVSVLDRILGLHVELAVQPLYRGQPDYLAALEELGGLGFKPAGFFPQTVARGELVEINGVLLRG
jgi:FkbM family methyltransferase